MFPIEQRSRCQYCYLKGEVNWTQRKCKDCNFQPALCQVQGRDCHLNWHKPSFDEKRNRWFQNHQKSDLPQQPMAKYYTRSQATQQELVREHDKTRGEQKETCEEQDESHKEQGETHGGRMRHLESKSRVSSRQMESRMRHLESRMRHLESKDRVSHMESRMSYIENRKNWNQNYMDYIKKNYFKGLLRNSIM